MYLWSLAGILSWLGSGNPGPRKVQEFDLSDFPPVVRSFARRPAAILTKCAATFDPFRLLLISIAGWLGQQQRDVIDYLHEENRVLRQQLGNKRLRLSDDQRRRLAAKAKKVARNLNDDVEGFLMGKRYLIHDRDPLYTAEFLGTLGTAGVKSVKLPPRSPNLNAHAERFVRTIKESCLERVILFGEGSLRKAIHELIAHYHY